MNAPQVLQQAAIAITGPREDDYGSGPATFGPIADTLNALGHDFTAADVALMMIVVKLVRLRQSPDHLDSWVDIAGYAALGAEAAGAS